MLLCGLMLIFCVTAISPELVGKVFVFLSKFELISSTLLVNYKENTSNNHKGSLFCCNL